MSVLRELRVLVTGGREYPDAKRVRDELLRLSIDWGLPVMVIAGDASGADAHALAFARSRPGWVAVQYNADWDQYGRAGGPIRNGWMLAMEPDVVLAFPGGTGTADMVRQAEDAGIPVEPIK